MPNNLGVATKAVQVAKEKQEEKQRQEGIREASALGKRIRQAREERGLIKSRCAKIIGISPARLADLEEGKTKKPTFKTLELVAKFLEVDATSLFQEFGYDKEVKEEQEETPAIILGKRIRRARELRGLSREKLAEIVDAGYERIGVIERGKINNMNTPLIKSILQYLEIELPE